MTCSNPQDTPIHENRESAYHDVGDGSVKQAMSHHLWLPSIHMVVAFVLRSPPPPKQTISKLV